ncbi:MAG TPA: cytochrome c biogenesis protein CcsA [Steroidobacteraceae bacterium]|nr:cytochrome c biogenesis protein CcsA [Steroidobacteraceae bacterium]
MATSHIVLALAPLVTYLAAAALVVRNARAQPAPRPWLAALIVVAGLVLHARILFGAIEGAGGALTLAITDSASLVGWVVAATTLVGMLLQSLAALPAAWLALAGLLSAGTGLFTGFAEIHSPQWEITAHIALAALAAGWLSIAALTVLLLAWQDAKLRSRAPLGVLAHLPPMETMETALFRALGGGFVLLTFVLVTGLFFVQNVVAQHLVHKMTLAIVAWIVFGVLLWGRVRYGWRGRRALRFTIAGFVILALAYFGSKFVLENLLGRHWG